MLNLQEQKAFFDYTDDRALPHLPDAPSYADIRLALAPNNAKCPLNKIVVGLANEPHMRTLRRFAMESYRCFNHSPRGHDFVIHSPAGQGKTFVVQRFAETLGIPLLHVNCRALRSEDMLLTLFTDMLGKHDLPLIEQHGNPGYDFYMPPCIVFLDDAHALPSDLKAGALLPAIDPTDRILRIQAGGQWKRIDTWEVCWIAATTDHRFLSSPLAKRLPTTIRWESADDDALGRIAQSVIKERLATRGSLTVPDSVFKLIAQYAGTPARVVYDFVPKMIQQKMLMPSCSWTEACNIVARDLGLKRGVRRPPTG